MWITSTVWPVRSGDEQGFVGERIHGHAGLGPGEVEAGHADPAVLAEATVSLITLEAALGDGTAAGDGDGERRRIVAGYNEDDCRATLTLRDWLEGRRVKLAERPGEDLPRPVFAEKPGAPEDPEVARIRSALLVGVSAETPGAIAWDVSAETPCAQFHKPLPR